MRRLRPEVWMSWAGKREWRKRRTIRPRNSGSTQCLRDRPCTTTSFGKTWSLKKTRSKSTKNSADCNRRPTNQSPACPTSRWLSCWANSFTKLITTISTITPTPKSTRNTNSRAQSKTIGGGQLPWKATTSSKPTSWWSTSRQPTSKCRTCGTTSNCWEEWRTRSPLCRNR